MKENSSSENNHNLVMFPSSKNFKLNQIEASVIDQDPLNVLIHEFSDIQEDQIPNYLDERFEVEEVSYPSLEAFMNRHQAKEAGDAENPLLKLINERLEAIKEAKERTKFYLDEIDMFFPNRKK
jgi:hypothetical protein